MDGVDTYLSTYPGSPVVLDVLGTADADEIRARAFELDPEGEEIFFFACSVGAMFGIRRRDGSRVAVKVHKLFTDEVPATPSGRTSNRRHLEGFAGALLSWVSDTGTVSDTRSGFSRERRVR